VFFLPAAALERDSQSDTGQATYGEWAGHNGGPPLEDEGLPPLFETDADGNRDWKKPVAELPAAWSKPLIVTPGDFVDHIVVEELVRWIIATQAVRKIVFDQFAAAQTMASRLNADFASASEPLAVVLHKSAANVTNPAKELEARVKAKKPSLHLVHDDNPVMNWNVGNAVVTRHVNGTIIPKKETPNSANKIDGVDAMINALAHFVAVDAPEPPSVYEERGVLVL
jgi:phage terminase large subunit-like protein